MSIEDNRKKLKEERRKSTETAFGKFYENQNKKSKGPQRKNTKPEKEVEKACLEWMRKAGWQVEIFEAKATYNPHAGIWMQQGMKDGTADCLGSNEQGIAVAVEFKAPGCRVASRLRDKQREFLVKKINGNNFAVVTDSVAYLEKTYNRWLEIRSQDLKRAQIFLLGQLP